MTPDPYAPYLRQADAYFAAGEVVKAGQIWQAILKQQPGHVIARECLMAVKQRLVALREAEAAAAVPASPGAPASASPESLPREAAAPTPPEPERPEPSAALDLDALVAEGCTLYDMGQLQDALKKWELALAMAPSHALARGYANGARQELGLPPLQATAAATPAQAEAPGADVDTAKLLREAVQLYDMGMVEEAITKWELVLALEPHRQEVEGYLKRAREEVIPQSPAARLPSHGAAAPPKSPDPEPESLDLKLRQADHLLSLQRQEEAAFTYQQALRLAPGNARALQGLERCRKPSGSAAQRPSAPAPAAAPVVQLDTQGRIAMAVEEARPVPPEPEGVEPPPTLLQAAPAPRQGLSLPDRFEAAAARLPWLREPRVMAALGGGILVLAAVGSLVHGYRKDQALKDEVKAARAAAMAPVAQQAQIPDLAESPESLREEAEFALVRDPLRAYLRAETLVSRNPGDAAGAQLLQKARAGLEGAVTGATLAEYQKHLQNGDLEAALKVMDALLRAQPGDAALRTRAERLNLALCTAHASQSKWEEAREDLLRGRALAPGDRSWQVRLRLLEHVKTLPKLQQPAWIPLLG